MTTDRGRRPPSQPIEGEPAYGSANDAIANVEDKNARAAFLSVRSEFYRVWDRVSGKAIEVGEAVERVSQSLESYIELGKAEKRSDVQRQETLDRLFRDVMQTVKVHLDKDEEFQTFVRDRWEEDTEKTNNKIDDGDTVLHKRIDGVYKWIIGALCAVVGSETLALGAFVWLGLKH